MSKNVVLITLDEVRPDHLSCYGYERIQTSNIDGVAKEGVRLETCITASNFTLPSHASILTGSYPPSHGLREAYTPIQKETLAEILKIHGYLTAAFIGNPALSSKLNFHRGFDYFEEHPPVDRYDGAFRVEVAEGENIALHQVRKAKGETFGNWWVRRAVEWIKNNRSRPFFVWGHIFDTHRIGEKRMFYNGWIKPGELSEFDYYDAKIKCVDERFIGELLNGLKELDLYDNTVLIIMSDHGTNLGEHPIPMGTFGESWGCTSPYPEHCTMYEHDIRVLCIIKDRDLPQGKVIEGITRTIDIVPTVLELLDINVPVKFDGTSLIPYVERGESPIEEAYIETLFESRNPGCLQAIRTKKYKFIRNLTHGVEALYDLENDPREVCNLLYNVENFTISLEERQTLLYNWRKKMNEMLIKGPPERKVDLAVKEEITKRLRQLGYLD